MGLFETFPYVNFQDLNLNELLRHMRLLLAHMKEVDNYVGGFDDRIKTLEKFMTQMESGKFSDAFLNTLYKWLHDNVPDIISEAVKQVWFGLTDSGYFIAYIPQSWNDIKFNTTGYDYFTELQSEYGHLVLSSRGN